MSTSSQSGLPADGEGRETIKTDKPVPFKVPGLLGKGFPWVEAMVGDWCTGALVIFMMFFIASEIIGRLLFNHSFSAIIDIVEACLVVVAFAPLSAVERDHAHLRMDTIPNKLSGRRAGSVYDCVILLLMLAVSAVLFYAVAKEALSAYQRGYIMPSIRWPIWPAAMFMPLGLLLLCIRLGVHIKRAIRSIVG